MRLLAWQVLCGMETSSNYFFHLTVNFGGLSNSLRTTLKQKIPMQPQKRSAKRPSAACAISIFFIFALLAASEQPAKAQTPVALSPVARQQFFSASGVPLANGCIFTYAAGTSTPQATYSESTGTYPNTNPIILDAGGFASIWLANSAYRIVAFSSGGLNCASGSQQWAQDNVSAYTILNQAQNLFLAGVTSDPSGTAGELGYRSDLGCFRGFTTLWDCFTENGTTATLTNKTIDISANTLKNVTNTAGHYPRNNGGTGYVDSAIQPTDLPTGGVIPNGVFGCVESITLPYTVKATDEQCLMIFSGAGTVTLPLLPATGFGGGTVFRFKFAPFNSGTLTIAAGGGGIDANGSYSLYSGQSVAIWSSGTAYYSEPATPLPAVIYNIPSAAGTADIPATTMTTAGANGGTYRFSFYADVVTGGASCAAASTVVVSVTFTDPNASSSVGEAVSLTNSGNTVATSNSLGGGGLSGAAGSTIPSNLAGGGSIIFRAKASTNIQYSVNFTAGTSCSPPASYQVYPILEQLSVN